jgi:demethylmenaquinone methyltransferase/2-methoxy-6-polyprenyl-1,4-benzoquinol methylase
VTAAEKARLVKEHFDRVARRYDLANTLLSFGLHHLWKRTAVRLLGLRPGERVIDVCGGTGDLAVLAARAVGAAGLVVLCDINRAMMAAGRLRVARAPGARIAFVQGDAESLPFAPGSFEAAMVGFGLRNLAHPQQGLKEMHRVLKPGGQLMCLEFSQPTLPWFRRLYDLYSFYIIPWAGKLIGGSRQAYTYLPESIRRFPLPGDLAALIREVGFTQVSYRPLSNGIAVVHLGTKEGR